MMPTLIYVIHSPTNIYIAPNQLELNTLLEEFPLNKAFYIYLTMRTHIYSRIFSKFAGCKLKQKYTIYDI